MLVLLFFVVMGTAGFVVTLVLIILQLIGAFVLSRNLGSFAPLEWAIMVIVLIWSIIVLIGLARNKRWAWPVALFLFAALTLNFLWFFFVIGGSLTLAVFFIISVLTLLVGFVGVDLAQMSAPAPATAPSADVEKVIPYTDSGKSAKTSALPKKRGRPTKKSK